MKLFILILLISYILSLTTTKKELFNLDLYGSKSYSGDKPSLSILDISGFEKDEIYISYYIKSSGFGTKLLNYSFTDNYPDEYFECTSQTKSTFSSTTSTGKKTNKKITSINLYFEIKKENKKYLVLENLLYKGYTIEVTHHKTNILVWVIVAIVIVLLLFLVVGSLVIYDVCKKKKKLKSESINFKKEEPSPLYPPTETYDSTQGNTIQMQQPLYVPQPIPPEVANTNDTGYSSGTGEQGYYSGMAYQS